jgi:carbon-monoxide dehydrogenase small subunit
VVEEWLQSNLCRCTSYQEIREAVRLMYGFAKDQKELKGLSLKPLL